ncbi:hypothetical protein GCM10010350_67360 [Streptomyces galilaeus]|nr:hypothetical protein GCM10010350_67360 [Streptomyces galilaeus]
MRKVEAMKFVVYVAETCGFRRSGANGGVGNVGGPIRVGVSVIGHFDPDTFDPDTGGRQ